MALFDRPVIETERLVLRRWKMQDMSGFLRFAADPEVMMAAGARPVLSPEEANTTLRRYTEDPYVFAIVLKATSEIMGKIRYQKDYRRPYINSVSVGYELARPFWGNGYMTEALCGMVRYAFDVMQMDVIGISHFTENHRSRRVIEKAGFIREGVIPYAFYRFDGRIFDEVTYSLTREEYLTGVPDSSRREL
ncbi:MAG: GNAT family N-acetyltransferase [Clostridia bacterium]|nr:GNAT family N-acetyltransferase [Clostridia bacterium]